MPTPRRSPKKTMRHMKDIRFLEEKRQERLLRESKGKLALEGPGTRKLRVSIGEDESYSGIDKYKPSPWRKTREELGFPKRVIGGKHHLTRKKNRLTSEKYRLARKKKPLD